MIYIKQKKRDKKDISVPSISAFYLEEAAFCRPTVGNDDSSVCVVSL